MSGLLPFFFVMSLNCLRKAQYLFKIDNSYRLSTFFHCCDCMLKIKSCLIVKKKNETIAFACRPIELLLGNLLNAFNARWSSLIILLFQTTSILCPNFNGKKIHCLVLMIGKMCYVYIFIPFIKSISLESGAIKIMILRWFREKRKKMKNSSQK